MDHRSCCTDTTAFRNFDTLIEISEHEPQTAPFDHRHFAAYVAIVLYGEYTESSADGVIQVGPGDLVAHPPLHRHANVFSESCVAVLNLVLPMPVGLNMHYAHLRLAELSLSQEDVKNQPAESIAVISEAVTRIQSSAQSETDEGVIGFAAGRLKETPAPKVYRVAAEAGVSTEHLIREFRARYGLSPGQYRAEHRFHHAVRKLFAGKNTADVACCSGYSDQPHMTRDFRQRTGMTPTRLATHLRNH